MHIVKVIKHTDRIWKHDRCLLWHSSIIYLGRIHWAAEKPNIGPAPPHPSSHLRTTLALRCITTQSIAAYPHTVSHRVTQCKQFFLHDTLSGSLCLLCHASPASKWVCAVGWVNVYVLVTGPWPVRISRELFHATENESAEPCCRAVPSMLKSWELFHSFLGSCEAWQKTQVLHALPIPFLRGAERPGFRSHSANTQH